MQLPVDYVINRSTLTWTDVVVGVQNGFFNYESIVDVAKKNLKDGSEDWRLIDLVNSVKPDSENAFAIMRSLAQEEVNQSVERSERKWIYLSIEWAYSNLPFKEFWGRLFDLYSETNGPKYIEKLLNFKSENTPSSWQELQTKSFIDDFLLKNEDAVR